jgi:hypothetical protein
MMMMSSAPLRVDVEQERFRPLPFQRQQRLRRSNSVTVEHLKNVCCTKEPTQATRSTIASFERSMTDQGRMCWLRSCRVTFTTTQYRKGRWESPYHLHFGFLGPRKSPASDEAIIIGVAIIGVDKSSKPIQSCARNLPASKPVGIG